MKQLQGFKYRFYPTVEQKIQLAQTFGCTRFVYNWALALRTDSYYQENKSLSYQDTSNALTKLKKEPEKSWLKEVSSVPLQQGLRHLNTAFKNFFAGRTKYPRFKKKNNKQSMTYAASAFKWQDGQLTLAKMSQPLKIKWSRYFTGQPASITISKDPSGRYFVSFLVEEQLSQWEKTDEKIGIDLGIKDIVKTSKGFGSGNPKYLRKYEARLKTLQRRLARKQKGSNNRYKAKLKVAKLHAKIADCRRDCLGARSLGRGTRPGSHRFLHKLSTKLVRENQSIFTETLAVKNMMANHKLAKTIADCGWGEFLRQLQYKCEWHDRELGAIDRWFPSSKRCFQCGHVLDQLPLEIREWQCPSCQKVNQRDHNAALNILAVGQTVLASGLSSNGDITSVGLVNLG